MEPKKLGEITHFFSKISVAVIELKAAVKVGDTIHIKGATTDFTMTIDSMQIEHNGVETAKAGQSIGLKVPQPVHEHDLVFKPEQVRTAFIPIIF